MNIKLLRCVLLLSLLVAGSVRVKAQDDAVTALFDMDLSDLFEVEVVSGTRSRRSLNQLPMRVYVITADDIRRNNYTSLVQALEDVPNIKTSRPGNGTEGETFLQRGLFGNYYTKFLLDDLPINPIVTSGFPLAEQLNMRNVERIEVLFGPASAIYGADAVAGVINIITKKPKGDEAQIVYTGGAGYDYGNVYGSYELKLGDSSAQLDIYGLMSRREDWDILDNYREFLSPTRYPQGDINPELSFGDIEARAWSAGTRFRYGGLSLSYDIRYRRDNSSIGQYTSWYFYDDPDAIWGETIQRGVLRYDTASKNLTTSTRLSYLRNRLDPKSYFSFIFPTIDPSTFGQRNRSYKYQASDEVLVEEIVGWRLSPTVELVSGFQGSYIGQLPKTGDLSEPFNESLYGAFSDKSLSLSPFWGSFGSNAKTVNQWGIFTQAAYTTDNLVVLSGLRFDRHSRFGSTVNPRAGIRYNFDSARSFTLNYGRAYKAPSPYFEFNSVVGLNEDGSINYLGVPSEGALHPEEFESLELGASQIWSSKFSTEANVFFNKLDNLLVNVLIPVDRARFPNAGNSEAGAFVNSGETQVKYWGVDLVVRARDVIPALGVSADMFVTYTDGEETFPFGAGSIDEMLNQPKWTTKLRLSTEPIDGLIIGVDNKWFSDWYARGVTSREEFETSPDARVSGDYVMDLYSTYNANRWLTLYLQVENVLDEGYFGIGAYRGASLPGNPQQGRSVYGGIELRFN